MNNIRIAGIAFHIHPVFWFVAAGAAITGKFFEIVSLFFIVLMHEIGHVATAKAFHWNVRQIELLPFGGVAKVDDWGATDAWEEVIVALAGPFVNAVMIVIAGLFWKAGWWDGAWSLFFIQGNVFLAGFNLLPIWPLDGGKVAQALVSMMVPYGRTLLASFSVSFSLALLMLGVSIYPVQPHLNGVVIALFLLVSNVIGYRRQPYQFLRFLISKWHQDRKKQRTLPLAAVLISEDITVMQALKKLRRGYYHYFCIVRQTKYDRRLQHVFAEDRLLTECFYEKRPQLKVSKMKSDRIQ